MDLTKIDQPFGTLDIETKLALHRAFYEGKVIEASYNGGEFEVCHCPGFYDDCTYRLRPEPLRDIMLPWAALDARWKWAARDSDGTVFVYLECPVIVWFDWAPDSSYLEVTDLFANFDPGNKPWRESLIRRQEGV